MKSVLGRNVLLAALAALCLHASALAAPCAGRLFATPQDNLAIADLPRQQCIDSGIPLSRLPVLDAQQIRAGVTLPDQAAVTKATEDFCS